MELSDLLVSYKRVDAPRFTPSIPIIEQFPSYQTPIDKETNTPSVSIQAKPTTSYSITSVQVPGFKAKWTSPYRDRNKWVSDLTQAYRRAGITNDNALKMLIAQDALESAWGRSAQGKFNFGNLTTGAKWKGDYVTGNDKNAKGQAIKQKFRSYNSIDEYAVDKLQFLKRLYDLMRMMIQINSQQNLQVLIEEKENMQKPLIMPAHLKECMINLRKAES